MRIPEIVKTITRIAATAIVGGIAGSCLAAIIFGLAFYFNERRWSMESANDWVGLLTLIGIFIGFLPGFGIGLIVGIVKPKDPTPTVIGAAVGLLVMADLFISHEQIYPLVRLFIIPACAFIGMIAGIVVRSIEKFQLRPRTWRSLRS